MSDDDRPERTRSRTRARGGSDGAGDPAKGQSAKGQQGGKNQQDTKESGGKRKGGGSRNKRRRGRRRGKRKRQQTVGFWGDASMLPEPDTTVRITDDPAAAPRSLGHPPLPGNERMAQNYFELVYTRATATAGAVAAAAGLIEPDDLVEELGVDAADEN